MGDFQNYLGLRLLAAVYVGEPWNVGGALSLRQFKEKRGESCKLISELYPDYKLGDAMTEAQENLLTKQATKWTKAKYYQK